MTDPPAPPPQDPPPAPPAPPPDPDPEAEHYDKVGASIAKHLAGLLKPAEPDPEPEPEPKDTPPKPGGLAGAWFRPWGGK